MVDKLTAMQDRMPQRCLKMLPAMQDRLFQRWLKSSQPCGIGCPEMLEKRTAIQDKYCRDV